MFVLLTCSVESHPDLEVEFRLTGNLVLSASPIVTVALLVSSGINRQDLRLSYENRFGGCYVSITPL